MKSKAAGCGSISTVISSIVLLCVSSIIIIMIIIIIIIILKIRIDKSQGDSLCRMCRKVDESIHHIISSCSKLAQKDYKRRHDNLGKVHWKLAINGMNLTQKVF